MKLAGTSPSRKQSLTDTQYIKPEVVSVATSTETVTYEDSAVNCVLLDDPKFTRSGRPIKKRDSLSYLYEDFDEDSVVVVPSVQRNVKLDEKQVVNYIKTSTTSTVPKRRGRPKKMEVLKKSKETDRKLTVKDSQENQGDVAVKEAVTRSAPRELDKETEKTNEGT